jgi:hypothetical protein
MLRNEKQAGWIIAVLAVAVLVPVGLRAEDAAQAARLSQADGQVRIVQNNQVLADSAVANTPIFEGTRLVTASDGRAEIQFEDGSVARLSPASSLTLTVLRGQGNGTDAEIMMEGGLGYFELQGAEQPGNVRVRFGDSLVTASGFTVLRINLDKAPGELAVFTGNAHLEIGNVERGVTLDLHGGESVALNASDPTRYRLAESIEPDSWDSWNADRDQALNTDGMTRTAATDNLENGKIPAWTDLDASGNWYNVPGQGYVWSPYEGASTGWDPYGSGYWMWTPRFGYIWVSGYSWGYMPFQCGAWNFYDGFGWGWAPGMGGCSPWWNGGYYQPNIGIAYGGYIPPRRPHGPIRPPGGGGRTGPHPLIAVGRIPGSGTTTGAVRERTAALVVGGQKVLPLRPLPEQSHGSRPESSFVESPRPTYARSVYGRGTDGNAGARAVYTPNPGQPGNGYTPRGNGPGAPPTSLGAGRWTPPAGASHGSSGGNSGVARSSSGGGGNPGGGYHAGGGASSVGSSSAGESHTGGGGGSAPSGGSSHK